MKTLFLSFIILFLFIPVMAQNQATIIGDWKGELVVSGTKLPLIFHIQESGEELSATMDSPAQGAKDIPVTQVVFSEGKITLNLVTLGASYKGKLISDNQIDGTFKQAGQSFPLFLNKVEEEKSNSDKQEKNEAPKRPQEPKAPFGYNIEEVKFENKQATDETTLAGTLTLPKTEKEGQKFPVVILISGSGAQDRNQEILGHKPFLVIADYLTKNGIAVLRYDDRGTAQSTGKFQNATSQDFATDVEVGIDFLKARKDIDSKNIGLIGHSEGGIIAPIVAAKKKNDVAFIILLAGVGVEGSKLLLKQQQTIGKASGINKKNLKKIKKSNKAIFEIIKSEADTQILKQKISNYLEDNISATEIPSNMSKEEFINLQVNRLTDEWLLYFLRYNPKENLSKTTCPILAINGEKDLQVDVKINLNAIEKSLKKAGNKKITIKPFPNLNHLFQTAETGLPSEYGIIEETFSPLVLEFVKNWIKEQI